MGNSLEQTHSQQQSAIPYRQSRKFIGTTQLEINSRQVANEHNLSQVRCQLKKKHSLKSLGGRGSSDSKQKKYLSLSKAASSETSILKASKLRKGINITATDQQSIRNSVDKFIKSQNKQTGQISKHSIKKLPIKPRDLPRYASHTKITPTTSLNSIPTPNVQISIAQTKLPAPPTRAACYQQQPNITIKFGAAQAPIIEDSLLASAVTPFVDTLTPCSSNSSGHYNPLGQNSGKKLKKVGMTRSFTHQSGLASIENDEDVGLKEKIIESNQIDGEYFKKNKFYSNRYIQQIKQKENQHIFTDPTLMSYIKKPQPITTMKETESIYAVAYYHNGTLIEKPISLPSQASLTSIIHQKYSLPQSPYDETLQDKVSREVQSKQLIEQKQIHSEVLVEQPFRFQTATDISYSERSDNASFIPLPPNYNTRIHDSSYLSDEVLNYCKPKINERVLADLLRLPLRL